MAVEIVTPSTRPRLLRNNSATDMIEINSVCPKFCVYNVPVLCSVTDGFASTDGVGHNESALDLINLLIKKVFKFLFPSIHDVQFFNRQFNCSHRTCEFLQGADVCATSCRTGMQPLHVAALYDCPHVAARLLRTGKCGELPEYLYAFHTSCAMCVTVH